MRRQFVIGVVFLGLSMTLATAGGDAVSIDGKYKVVSLSKGGKTAPNDIVADINAVVIKNGTFTVDKKPVSEVASIKIDGSKAPAHIEVRSKSANDKERIALGIFKLEKETLTIVISRGARPVDFDGKGEDEMKMVLTKIKE